MFEPCNKLGRMKLPPPCQLGSVDGINNVFHLVKEWRRAMQRRRDENRNSTRRIFT